MLLLFSVPVTLVFFIHIYIAITDNSMTKSEHLGYALIHIPFSMVFSFFAVLFFIPNETKAIDINDVSKDTLLLCSNKKEIECINSFLSKK